VSSQVISIGRSNDVTEFLYVGRIQFTDPKILKDLLDALTGLQGNFHLHVIGDGADRPRCEGYAIRNGINHRITWHGWKDKPWDYFQSAIGTAHALVLPTAYEGLPLVLLEAMSRGLYCIASDCITGPGEIITPGVNGTLYAPGNVVQLRDAMSLIVDGTALPEQKLIRQSIKKFYDHEFIEQFTRA